MDLSKLSPVARLNEETARRRRELRSSFGSIQERHNIRENSIIQKLNQEQEAHEMTRSELEAATHAKEEVEFARREAEARALAAAHAATTAAEAAGAAEASI